MEGESALEAIRPLALETGVPDAAIRERMEGLPRRGRVVGSRGTAEHRGAQVMVFSKYSFGK